MTHSTFTKVRYKKHEIGYKEKKREHIYIYKEKKEKEKKRA